MFYQVLFYQAFGGIESEHQGIFQLLTSPTGLFVTLSGLIGVVMLVFMNKNSKISAVSQGKSDVVFEDEKPKATGKQGAQKKPKKN